MELRILSPFGEYWELYENGYGLINYADKKVLDIGCDHGSTADFFIQKGAKFVIGIDSNPDFIAEFKKNIAKYSLPALVIAEVIDNANLLSRLILGFSPDVVKLDCEGCEKYLLDVPEDILIKVPEYILEVHSNELLEQLKQKFVDYEIITVPSTYLTNLYASWKQ